MANLFTDFPERVEQIRKYSDLESLYGPLEEAFGEKDFFKSSAEAMEFYVGALDEIGKFAANEMRPAAGEIDREGAKFKDGVVTLPEKLLSHLGRCAELGVFGASVSRKYDGLNLPRVVELMALEMFAHACPNTALTIACFSMADFVHHEGSEEQKQRYLPKLITNEWQTSMALTEPNAGSDLGKLRSRAERRGDSWIINGTKHFITNGSSDITFALVRTDPNSQGLNGLSVLIVPREIDGKANYRVTKIEDKVCLHASPTCEIVFENSVGELMGAEGQGFKVMAELMNGARLAMAALATGIAAAALDEAKQYAKTRVTMGKAIINHPMIADMLYEAEIEIRAMRSMVMEAAIAHDRMRIAQKQGNEAEFKRWKKRYRRLTPLAKYLCCERAIVIAKNAVQIFGGYGVCREYPVERLWRETIIYPIYEGTSQIQSLMVLKDTLKDVAQNAGGYLGSLAGNWVEGLVSRDGVKARVREARAELDQGIKTILMSLIKGKFKSDIEALRESGIQEFLKNTSLQLLTSRSDLTYPFLWAERFTRITSDYYALKCMADRWQPGDTEREKWILEYAKIAIPRMRLENHYMKERQPSTLEWMKQFEGV